MSLDDLNGMWALLLDKTGRRSFFFYCFMADVHRFDGLNAVRKKKAHNTQGNRNACTK